MTITLGIDVGGSGIKGAPVNTETGDLLEERYRVLTPQPATPQAVAASIVEIAKKFNWKDRIGCGVPSVIKDGMVLTAANIDPAWIGTNGKTLFESATHCKVNLINDADAAGIAEMTFGAGKGVNGVVFMITVGTGIGSALFLNGNLVPNTEFGHMEIRGKDAEHRASAAVKEAKDLSWKEWAERFNEFLQRLETLFWPDLIIIGGGVAKYFDRFAPQLTVKAELRPAKLLNEAGIVGAAMAGLHQPLPDKV